MIKTITAGHFNRIPFAEVVVRSAHFCLKCGTKIYRGATMFRPLKEDQSKSISQADRLCETCMREHGEEA